MTDQDFESRALEASPKIYKALEDAQIEDQIEHCLEDGFIAGARWARKELEAEMEEMRAHAALSCDELRRQRDELTEENSELVNELEVIKIKLDQVIGMQDAISENERLKADLTEEFRLSGLGANREHKLLTEIERLKSELRQAKSDEDKIQGALNYMRALFDEKTLELEQAKADLIAQTEQVRDVEDLHSEVCFERNSLKAELEHLNVRLEQAHATIQRVNDKASEQLDEVHNEVVEFKLLAESYRAKLKEILHLLDRVQWRGLGSEKFDIVSDAREIIHAALDGEK